MGCVMKMQIRLMRQDDVDAVLELEKACFHDMLDRDEIQTALKSDQIKTIVAVAGPHLVGYTEVEMFPKETLLNTIAVSYLLRRNGIGSKLVRLITADADRKGIPVVTLGGEADLPYQLFLRSRGFRCEEILHGGPGGSTEYLFEWRSRHDSSSMERAEEMD